MMTTESYAVTFLMPFTGADLVRQGIGTMINSQADMRLVSGSG
jgi:hypothetical protein